MPLMFVTALVSKLDRSSEVNDEDRNMLPMLVTALVSKLDRSSEVSDEQK